MKKLMLRYIAFLLLGAAAMTSMACATQTINKVLADPTKYRNSDVKLSGSVVNSYSVVGNGAYELDDKTGRLWIISRTGVPRRGAQIVVTGRVREGFNLGVLGDVIKLPASLNGGLVLMESSHKAK